MSRIELHQARFRAHAELGFYQAWRTDQPQRPQDRYCACGTRLRRTKPHYERLCDACQAKPSAPTYDFADEQPWKYDTCPVCGNPKRTHAKKCRACWRYEVVR